MNDTAAVDSQSTELALSLDTRACRDCKWFWGPVTPYGPVSRFHLPTPLPPEVRRVLPILQRDQDWLTAKATEPGEIDPAILHGCRKAPIMTLGINPNLSAFYATPEASAFAYPRFEDPKSYAYYYRYRSVFQEKIDRTKVPGKLTPGNCLIAAHDGVVLAVERGQSHRWVQIRVRYADGHEQALDFAWDKDEVPSILAERGTPFAARDVLAGCLAVQPGTDLPLLATPTGYYLRFEQVLHRLSVLMDWPRTLRVGEDVAQGDLVACASPGWTNAAFDIPQDRIIASCAGSRRFILRQVLQSQPRVLILVGKSAFKMFCDHIPARPALRALTQRFSRTFELLRETAARPYYFEARSEGIDVRARVLCVPHFSYEDNYARRVRMPLATWQAFSAAHHADATTLIAGGRVDENAEEGVSIELEPDQGSLESRLSAQGLRELAAHFYDPVETIAGVLREEVRAGRLELDGERLKRTPGGCNFCKNDQWQFEEGCPYGSDTQRGVSDAESRRVAAELSRPAAAGPPASAVRVWRGTRRSGLTAEEFAQKLQTVFVPATVHMIQPLGLVGYLPTLLPEAGADIPSELALVFYRSQDSYAEAMKTATGKAYGALHGSIFEFAGQASRSDFPLFWQSEFLERQPYHLFVEPTDWQLGCTEVLVARIDPRGGRERLAARLHALRNQPPVDLDGYVFVVEGDLWLRWAHYGVPRAEVIAHAEADALVDVIHESRSRDFALSTDPTRTEPVPFTAGTTLNVRFERA